MPYNTRNRPYQSESPPPHGSPSRRAPSKTFDGSVVHPRLRDVVCKEDAENDVLMAACSVLADIKDARSLGTHEMARYTPHKAQALSTCIRAHLRRNQPPHLLFRHEPAEDGKIPTYSLNVPLSPPANDKIGMEKQLEQAPAPMAVSHQPADESDMQTDDDATVDMDDEELTQVVESPRVSLSPASPITPPPLSSSAPRLRTGFAQTIILPSRGISPDNTSDGSSPPSTPRSPVSPLVHTKHGSQPLSPTSAFVNHGLSTMLISPIKSEPDPEMPQSFTSAMDGIMLAPTEDSHTLAPPFGPPFRSPSPPSSDLKAQQDMVIESTNHFPPAALEPESRDSYYSWANDDDWMAGPESMPLDELDRVLDAAGW